MKTNLMMVCGLCSKPVRNRKPEILDSLLQEVLEVLLLNKFWPNDQPCKMCKECSKKIKKLFNFKGQCIITEDVLFPYVSKSTEEKEIDLIEVYTKENNKKVNATKTSICRLCLKVANRTSVFFLQDILENYNLEIMFKEYFQELNIKVTSDPQVCSLCVENLQSFAEFIEMCESDKLKINIDKLKEKKLQEPVVKIGVEAMKVEEQLDATAEDKDPEKTVKCSQCDFKTKSSVALKVHITLYHNEQIRCQQCSYTTQSKNQLKTHLIEQHNSSMTFDCDLCNFSTKNGSSYRKHRNQHTKASLECRICKTKVSRQDLLKDHMKFKHGNPEKHVCNICSFSTIYPRSLKKHTATHTKQKPFACPECDYKTGRSDCLKLHAMKHRSKKDLATFKCEKCSYETTFKNSLLAHFVSHAQAGRKSMCAVCDQEFKYTRDHKAHMREAHGGKGLYTCKQCPLVSVNRDSLRNHVKNVHGYKQKMKCTMCELEFAHKFTLQSHLDSCHNKNFKLFSCDKCDYKAKSIVNFQKHRMFKHAGFENSIKEIE